MNASCPVHRSFISLSPGRHLGVAEWAGRHGTERRPTEGEAIRDETWHVVVVAAGLIGVAGSYSALDGWWGADFLALFLVVGLAILANLAGNR